MDIDLRTLALLVVIANILQAFAIAFLYVNNKKYRGIGCWMLGSALTAVGITVMLMRDDASIGVISIIVSNTLLISGYIFTYAGIMRFFDRRVNLWLVIPVFVLFIVLFLYFIYPSNDINARTVVMSIFLAYYLFLTVSALLWKRPPSITDSAHFIAAVDFFLACFYLFRAGYTLTTSSVEGFFTPTLVQTATFMLFFAGGFLLTVGQIIMVNQRLNGDAIEAKEHFELFFHTSPDGILISRFDNGIIVDINEGFTHLTGFERDDAIGSSVSGIHLWKNPGERRVVLDEIRKKGFCENFEAMFRRKDGSERIGILSARIITLQDVPHVISVTRDITDRKRAEEALRQTNKKLNMLSSITRHDILNQIMGIRGYLEFSMGIVKDPKLMEYLEIENNAVDMIQKQIEFTRYYQDIGVEEPKWQDAEDIVGKAAENLDLKDIVVNNSLKGLEIFADPLIEKVFYNLMENSLRHGEDVSTIDFSYSETGNGLVISYRDDGVGISKEGKRKLFERGVGNNTGLGLFLSREILSITGITIEENGEPGRGVLFEMTVPKGAYRVEG